MIFWPRPVKSYTRSIHSFWRIYIPWPDEDHVLSPQYLSILRYKEQPLPDLPPEERFLLSSRHNLQTRWPFQLHSLRSLNRQEYIQPVSDHWLSNDSRTQLWNSKAQNELHTRQKYLASGLQMSCLNIGKQISLPFLARSIRYCSRNGFCCLFFWRSLRKTFELR